MFKKFVSSFLALLMLCGCGNGSVKKNTADCATQAEQIVKALAMEEKMDAVQGRVIQGLFFFEDDVIQDQALYIANDKSADVVGVFIVSNMDSAKASIQTYLTTLKAQMQNYYPDEVFKIDNAVVMNNDTEVILIIANDLEKAKEEAKTLLGQ